MRLHSAFITALGVASISLAACSESVTPSEEKIALLPPDTSAISYHQTLKCYLLSNTIVETMHILNLTDDYHAWKKFTDEVNYYSSSSASGKARARGRNDLQMQKDLQILADKMPLDITLDQGLSALYKNCASFSQLTTSAELLTHNQSVDASMKRQQHFSNF